MPGTITRVASRPYLHPGPYSRSNGYTITAPLDATTHTLNLYNDWGGGGWNFSITGQPNQDIVIVFGGHTVTVHPQKNWDIMVDKPHGEPAAIQFYIFGDGATIATGVAGELLVPFACTITSATMLADRTTNAVVDIWKSNYSGYPPTSANSITGSDPLTLTSASKMQDSTLTGWTTSINAGDILRFSTTSCSAAQRLLISLQVTG